ncbi:MAG: hypothetical protein WAZ18_02650 [Alphaproteobacteria bacterium]
MNDKTNVLLIDDCGLHSSNLKHAKEAMQGHKQALISFGNFNICTALTPEDAVREIKRAKHNFHVIVCDIDLGTASGPRLLRQLKENNLLIGHESLAICSGAFEQSNSNSPEAKELLSEWGVHRIIPKSTDIKTLSNIITQLAENSKARLR